MPEQGNTGGRTPERRNKKLSWQTGFAFKPKPGAESGPPIPEEGAGLKLPGGPQVSDQQVTAPQAPEAEAVPDEEGGALGEVEGIAEIAGMAAAPSAPSAVPQGAPAGGAKSDELSMEAAERFATGGAAAGAAAEKGTAAGAPERVVVAETALKTPPEPAPVPADMGKDRSTGPKPLRGPPQQTATPTSPSRPAAGPGTGATVVMPGVMPGVTPTPPGGPKPDGGTGATIVMPGVTPTSGTGMTVIMPPAAGFSRGEVQPPEKISNTRFARIVVESGMADTAAIRMGLEVIAGGGGGGEGRPKDLGEALVSVGVLTEQQVHTLEQVAREGGEGSLLGAYQLMEKLGAGGMGTVYKARQVALDRTVALKILPERLSSNAEFVGRFEREARAVAKLDHPNIVRAIDAGKASGKYFFVMEFVEGASLEDILQDAEVIAEDKATNIAIQAARGLECAWRNGLVHRDIKPDNILITTEGVAKIADLGLAREIDTADARRLTQDGAAMGTPHYISPEQARGQEVDIRTDIYALGITLYRMVTGKLPFTGKDPVSIIMARFHETPPPANEVRDDISDELAQVIATMMALEREVRYPDPVVLQHDLELVAHGEDPEYASGNQELREKAIETARSRRPLSTTFGAVVVSKRRKRERTFIIGGVVVAAAMVVSGLFLGSMYQGGSGDRSAGAGISEEEAAALKELEEGAAAFCEELKGLFDGGKYAEVVGRADEIGTRYARTSSGPKVVSLRRQASDELEKIERRRAAEAEKERRYSEFIRQARENVALKDHATATALLTQAKAIKDTDEAKELLAEARRMQCISRAEEAERAEKLEEAVDLYGRALVLKDDSRLRGRVAELERRVALAKRMAEGSAFARRSAWKSARASYRRALKFAKGDERPPVEKKLASVGSEIAYLELIMKARADAMGSRWRAVLEGATKASLTKPEAAEPKELVIRARRAIGPEKHLTNSLGMQFALVGAGEFTMGSEAGDLRERPVRRVRLDAYYISVHEVTNARYEEFDPRHRRTEYSSRDDTPVVAVSWRDADDFCRWLSKREGIEYRLPTEAEWEMAARGPSETDSRGRTFPWGDEAALAGDKWRCNIAAGARMEDWGKDGHTYAAPVGSYPAGASPFGCMDMAGNVWEWCLDWYRGDYYRTGGTSNPRGPAAGKQHIMRGGSFANPLKTARSSKRAAHGADFVEASVGFRVVRALDPIFLDSRAGGEGGGRP